MAVVIGSARIDENGKAKGGKAGKVNPASEVVGKEVTIGAKTYPNLKLINTRINTKTLENILIFIRIQF